MQIFYKTILLWTALLLITACVEDEREAGMGGLSLSVGVNSETITVQTKADSQPDSCLVLIKNRKGDIIQKYNNAVNLPSSLWLIAGGYTVEAQLGTPKKAEFDHPCYRGVTDVDIEANKTINKEVTCLLMQSKVTVTYGKGVTSNFKEYTTTVSMSTSKLEFKQDENKVGYFYNNTEEEQDLLCKVVAKTASSQQISYEHRIKSVKPKTHYKLTIDYAAGSNEGGAKIVITEIVEPDIVNDDAIIGLNRYPIIQAPVENLFTQSTDLMAQPQMIKIVAKGYPTLKELKITTTLFTEVWKLSVESVDFLAINPTNIKEFTSKGFIIGTRTTDPGDPFKNEQIEIQIPVPITKPIKETKLLMEAKDGGNHTRTLESTILVDDIHVKTLAIAPEDIWSTYATIYGSWFGTDRPEKIGFEYKEEGEGDWTRVSEITDLSDKKYSTVLKGLKKQTTYRYRVYEIDNNETKYSGTETFTTDPAFVIPNLNFDNWVNVDNVWYPAKDLSDANYWWDTANKGVSLMGKNPTMSSQDVHTEGEGKLAARLASTTAANKFAAGNLYTGKFGVVIMSGGMGADLYFGRPYTDRPTQLKGWFKYTAGSVTHNPQGKLKGPNDIGSVFILLCDWSKPHYMDTTNPSTFIDFSKNNRSIIAYGEIAEERLSETMNSYEEFTIDLKYRDLKKKPSYILIVASASKYGDYFTGSTSSVLLLDDFELVFGDNPMEDK